VVIPVERDFTDFTVEGSDIILAGVPLYFFKQAPGKRKDISLAIANAISVGDRSVIYVCVRAIVFVRKDGENKKGETMWVWGGVAHFVTGGGGGGGGTYILECAFAQLEALIVSFLGRVRL